MKNEIIRVVAPLDSAVVTELHAGDRVLLSGSIITGRDAAHKRMTDLIKAGEALPFPLKARSSITLVPRRRRLEGPWSARPHNRLSYGCVCTAPYRTWPQGNDWKRPACRCCEISDGEIRRSIFYVSWRSRRSDFAVHQTGGHSGLGGTRTEAVRRLVVEDLPLVVATDVHGGDLYVTGPAEYRQA